MEIQIGNPAYYLLFALVGLIVLVVLWASWSRRRALSRFASSMFRAKLYPADQKLSWISSPLLIAGLIALVVALLDIRWDKTKVEVPQKGIEIVFALDVSRSMLAEDTSPNRLRRAKQQITDLLDEMSGDRVGLVVFAGEAKRVVPLTNHYEDFKRALENVGPDSVRIGGSKLASAIEVSVDSFMGKTNDHKTIVLLTDGEDQESDPIGLAKKYHNESGLRVFTIGLGDVDQGARIPKVNQNRRTYLKYEGKQVWSKLNGEILKSIATETKGAYIPAGTKQVNMYDIYHRYIANIEKQEFESATIDAYVPRYQWFASLALVLFMLEIVVSTTRWKAKS